MTALADRNIIYVKMISTFPEQSSECIDGVIQYTR